MTRRTLLAAAFAAPLARSADGRIDVGDVRVISPPEAGYAGWPTLARTKKGRLLLAWSGGRESHVCPFGRVELSTSDDDGANWSWPQTVMDSPIDDRDAGVLEAADGSLLITTFTSLAYEDRWYKELQHADTDQARRWRAVQARTTPEQRKGLLGTWMLRSTDGGLSWSKPYRVPVNSPHGPTVLADGRLLYPGVALWRDDPWRGVTESRDHGATWRRLATIPTRPGDDATAYHEMHLAQASSSKLVVHIRNHNQKNERETLQTESTDGGKTWSVPEAIGVWGLPSHLVRLRDGRLLMSYGYRREPFGIQVRTSEDDGGSWSEALTLTADAADHDLGYPSTVELDNGRLVTIWYERMMPSRKAVLRQATWRLR